MNDTKTPELPWLPPMTPRTYVCQSGMPHLIGDTCACTPRSP